MISAKIGWRVWLFRVFLTIVLGLFHLTGFADTILVRRNGKPVAEILPVVHGIASQPVTERLVKDFSGFDAVATELGVSQYIQFQEEISKLYANSMQGTSLVQIVGTQTFGEFASALGATESQLSQLQRMHPYVASRALLSVKCPVSASQGKEPEGQLLLLAQKHGIPIQALESLEDQFRAIPSTDSSMWAKYVRSTISFSGQSDCGFKLELGVLRLREAAASDKPDRVVDIVRESYADLDYKEFDDQFIGSRNLRMADRMVSIIEGKRYPLFAVGAAHLYGDYGILSMLSKRGFEIVRGPNRTSP